MQLRFKNKLRTPQQSPSFLYSKVAHDENINRRPRRDILQSFWNVREYPATFEWQFGLHDTCISCHQLGNLFYNVSVGLNSPTHDQISFSESFHPAFSNIFEKRVQGPASLLEAGHLCLEDLLVSFPSLPWADMLWYREKPQLENLAIDSNRIKIMKSRLSARVRQDEDLPEEYSTSVRYSTKRRCSLNVDGGMHDVRMMIHTLYSIPAPLQDESAQPRRLIPQTGSHGNLQSDWHHDGVRGVLSGSFDGLQDLAHRLVLKLWSINQEKALAIPLEAVKVFLQAGDLLERKEIKPRSKYQIAMRLDRREFERVQRSTLMNPHTADEHTGYVALGSNVDDRMALIESACKSMETRGIEIVRTSALYETAPMYYENQQPFINGVCQVRHFFGVYR